MIMHLDNRNLMVAMRVLHGVQVCLYIHLRDTTRTIATHILPVPSSKSEGQTNRLTFHFFLYSHLLSPLHKRNLLLAQMATCSVLRRLLGASNKGSAAVDHCTHCSNRFSVSLQLIFRSPAYVRRYNSMIFFSCRKWKMKQFKEK